MGACGWMINLTGRTVPVYKMQSNGAASSTKVGQLTNNECFIDGSAFGAGWEGVDYPVIFWNSSYQRTSGVVSDSDTNFVEFSEYASNGTSWVKVSTLERKVQYATEAYYADGSKLCDLPAGSKVWLTLNATRGQNNPNYVAVTAVQPAGGNKISFSGNGFIDLMYGNRWVNVSSILLRKV